MRITFVCNNGANIHSARKETLDEVNDLGLEEGEWAELNDDERAEILQDWANNFLEIYWEAD